jgi:DNA-binding NarL/FixJ family response regulator
MTAAAARIAVVEDHDRYRQTMRAVIELMPAMVVAWEAGDGESALELLAEHPVDLVIVDLSLPGVSGIELVSIIQRRWPTTPCVVVSGHAQRRHADRSLEAGARGYMLKGRPAELRDGISAALAGDRYLSPRLAPPGEGT